MTETNKSLGQVAFEAVELGRDMPRPWISLQNHRRDEWECAAQAVVGVVRKQTAAECAKICDALEPPNWALADENNTYAAATFDCESAIKERFGLDELGTKP